MSSPPPSAMSKTGRNFFIAMSVFLTVHLVLNVFLLVTSHRKPPLAFLSTAVILTLAVLLLVGRFSQPPNWLRFRWHCLVLLVVHLIVSAILVKTGNADEKLFAAVSSLDIFISLICFGYTLVLGV